MRRQGKKFFTRLNNVDFFASGSLITSKNWVKINKFVFECVSNLHANLAGAP